MRPTMHQKSSFWESKQKKFSAEGHSPSPDPPQWQGRHHLHRLHPSGHAIANLLSLSDFTTSRILEGKELVACKFRSDISIHGHAITTSGFWKQRAAILKFHFWFPFDLFTVIGVPNFIGMGLSAAALWRHSNFQDGGRQPCWIWFRAIVAHPRSASGGVCFILKFRLDRIYSFRDRAIFTSCHFGLKLPIHAHFYGV